MLILQQDVKYPERTIKQQITQRSPSIIHDSSIPCWYTPCYTAMLAIEKEVSEREKSAVCYAVGKVFACSSQAWF